MTRKSSTKQSNPSQYLEYLLAAYGNEADATLFEKLKIPLDYIEKCSPVQTSSLGHWLSKGYAFERYDAYSCLLSHACDIEKAGLSPEEGKRWTRNGNIPWYLEQMVKNNVDPDYYYDVLDIFSSKEKVNAYLKAAREVGINFQDYK
jgi:hypothetical protein